MKIEVTKPQEEVKWKFPCIGVDINDNDFIVAFTDNRKGIVLKQGNEEFSPYSDREYREDWTMDKFILSPLFEPNPNPIDLDNVELPIWLLYHGNLITISDITGKHMRGFVLKNNGCVVKWDYIYDNIKDRDEDFKFIEILPKGTRITLEL